MMKSTPPNKPSGRSRRAPGKWAMPIFLGLALVAVAAVFWLSRGKRAPDPVPAGKLGIVISDFESLVSDPDAVRIAQRDEEELAAALRDAIGGAQSPFRESVETLAFPWALDATGLYGGKARRWLEQLNAHVIFGRQSATRRGDIPDALIGLRLPASTAFAPRPAMERIAAHVAYPEVVAIPGNASPLDSVEDGLAPAAAPDSARWQAAARLARAHLMLSSEQGGSLYLLFAKESAPLEDKNDWAEYNSAVGALALAAAVAANGGESSVKLAIRRLTAAREGFTQRGDTESLMRASVNLASCLTLQGESADDFAHSYQHLLSIRQSLETWSDSQARAVGLYTLARAALAAPADSRPPAGAGQALRWLELAELSWTRQRSSYSWALLQLARAEAERSLPDSDMDAIIVETRAALEVLTRERFPGEWAEAHRILGGLFAARSAGNKAENLKTAETHYTRAIGVWESTNVAAALTRDWIERAKVRLLAPDDVAQSSLRGAIEDLYAALERTDRASDPERWSLIHHLLGVAVQRLEGGASETRFREAIDHYYAALEERPPDRFPVEAAMTLNNLGRAFQNYPGGDRMNNLREALKAYDSAIEALEFGMNRALAPQIRRNRDEAQWRLDLLIQQAQSPRKETP